MKSRKIVGAVAVLIAIITLSATCTSGKKIKAEDGMTKGSLTENIIRETLLSGHYLDMKLDDEFAEKVFDAQLKSLDYYKLFLTQKDISKLNKFKTSLDDDFRAGRSPMFELSYAIITERLAEAKTYYQELLAKPFDLTLNENYEYDSEKLSYATNTKELKNRWLKHLQNDVVEYIYHKQTNQNKATEKSDTVTIKPITVLEKEAREKTLKTHNQWFKRLQELTKEERFSTYINAHTSVFDPHTSFFPPKQKEDFDISISGRLEGIGATLQEKEGYIKVTKIVPGSASWKQGDLEPEDVILKVGQGDKDPVDIVDMRLSDAVRLIRGSKGTEVRLTVRKQDGSEMIIPIIRDIVVLEETYAKSIIVEDSLTGKKYGYINLPQFYVDFTGTGGRSCFEDVGIEIEKLKRDNIDGIVFDLRNNGGGSLQDVVKMVGLFIAKGPIVQIKPRSGKPYVYSDYDPKIQFDGELVVMVNEQSASASEIFAAAIQDYNRGIILGSPSSYGKGTVQGFQDLDNYVPEALSSHKPLGSLKLTTHKFYRVNGGSTQWKGVEPHIVIPDVYMYGDYGEKKLDNSIKWDEIPACNYTKWNSRYNESSVISASEIRIDGNNTFKLIEENAKRYKRLRESTQESLNLERFTKSQIERKESGKKYEKLFDNKHLIKTSITLVDQEIISADSTKLASMEQLSKVIAGDPYVLEAMNILTDMKK